MGAVLLITFVLLGAGGWLVGQLWGQQARLHTRLAALEGELAAPAGQDDPADGATAALAVDGAQPAPSFVLPDLDGHEVSLDALLAPGRPLLLGFTDPRCPSCPEVLPDLARWQQSGAALSVALISTGTPDANRPFVAPLGLAPVLLQRELEVVQAYGLDVAPAAVLIRPDGTRDGTPAYGTYAIRQLGARLVGETVAPLPSVAPLPQVGDIAPPLSGRTLDGSPLDLASYRGRPVLVLFWNPACSHCQGLVPAVRNWIGGAPAGLPPLVLVARGTTTANQALNLSVPILLDPELALARAWGIGGTPWACLVDGAGRVAAPVARGATAVRTLVAQAVHGLSTV